MKLEICAEASAANCSVQFEPTTVVTLEIGDWIEYDEDEATAAAACARIVWIVDDCCDECADCVGVTVV